MERHGHVKPLPSGAVARCGGPRLGCEVCLAEEKELEAPAKLTKAPAPPRTIPTPTGPAPAPKPTIGRAVHYEDAKLGTCAATIANLLPNSEADAVLLYVIRNSIPENIQDANAHVVAPFSEEPKPGHWNWPPRV